MNADAATPARSPLVPLLQLPGVPTPTGDVPVCGPDGCAVPQQGSERASGQSSEQLSDQD